MGNNSPAALLIFLFTIGISLYGLFINRDIIGKFILHPYTVKRTNQWHKIITSGFVHNDLGHLLFNMLSFYFFAFNLESYYLGTLNFLIVYFGSMIIADIPSIIKHSDDYGYYSLGASGAISGVLFSMILFSPFSKLYVMFIPIPIPAWIFGILYLLYCQFAPKYSQDNINHSAHFWGALGGIILTLLFERNSLFSFLNNF